MKFLLLILLSGCASTCGVSSGDIEVAQELCETHGGLRSVASDFGRPEIYCNDGFAVEVLEHGKNY